MSYIVWFKDLTKDSIATAGGKGANLGEMVSLNLPVPNGFAVTAQTYKEFIERTGIKDRIQQFLVGLNIEDTDNLQHVAEQIQKLISSTPIPEDMVEGIMDNYELLGMTKGAQALVDSQEVFVAVRSSATAEDLPSISEEEHILVVVDGKPLYKKMKELAWLDPEKQRIEIPAMEQNEIKWKRVSALYKHPVQGDKLYKITTVTGREVTISPNHSLIILDEDTLLPKVKKIIELKGNEKVPAISRLPEINCQENHIDLREYVKGSDVIEKEGKVYIKNKSTNWIIQHPLSRNIPVSTELAYFLGVYVAEGSTYKGNHVMITNSDPEVMSRIISFLKSLGLYQSQKINKHTVRVYCKAFVTFLHTVAGEPSTIRGKGRLSSVKKIPDFVFGWNKKLIGEFLRGAYDGDGGIEPRGIGYSSTSPLLIGGMIKLLEILGLEFNLSKRKSHHERWRDHQRILIPSREAVRFKAAIGFQSNRKSLLLNKHMERHEQKSYFPEFNHTLKISPALSAKIKETYESNLPQQDVERFYCPGCDLHINKSSKYKSQERFYCSSCHKTYYEKSVVRKTEKLHKYYDQFGQFKKGARPWNKGILQGTLSQKEFSKEMKNLGVTDFDRFFNGSVRWDQIRTVEEISYTGLVYDFTVPEVENFAAGVGGIITHNSASFAGQQATFLNVKGKDNVVNAVRDCWASLFTARAIYYREKQKFDHAKVLISALVQKMVNADRSGIMFTINPATNHGDEIVIEAIYGLGEMIVGGEVNPDMYIVDKNGKEIKKIEIRKQEVGLFRNSVGLNEKKPIARELQERQKISEREVKELARLGKKLEEHYGRPQDIEWAIERNEIFIVQTRAVTTFKAHTEERAVIEEEAGKILLKGETASAGVYSGPVKIVLDLSHLGKVQKGDILVTPMTTPDMVPAMEKAGAIVTNDGGLTCHAAIVAREMGTPCIVGTEHATDVLKDGEIVTVHASRGLVYEGAIEIKKEEKTAIVTMGGSELLTATEIKVIVDLPDKAERAAATGADGVGLVRSEIIIAMGGIHPAEYIRQEKDQDYVNLLKEGIRKIAQAFKGKPVWVRCSDMRSDEYRNLKGGEKEPQETDPMIGWHAIRRLLDEPRILKAEFQAIRELHYEGWKSVGVMIPFVIRVEEVRQAKEMMRAVGLEPVKAVPFGIMVETPASCWIIEDLCKEGISFVSFGTNDLTQLTLGIDRNNERIAKLFDEMHPAVLGEIAKVIKVCRKYGVTTSICGQAGSRPEMAEFLVHQGIDSISANVDAVEQIRKVVARVERKVLMERKR